MQQRYFYFSQKMELDSFPGECRILCYNNYVRVNTEDHDPYQLIAEQNIKRLNNFAICDLFDNEFNKLFIKGGDISFGDVIHIMVLGNFSVENMQDCNQMLSREFRSSCDRNRDICVIILFDSDDFFVVYKYKFIEKVLLENFKKTDYFLTDEEKAEAKKEELRRKKRKTKTIKTKTKNNHKL